jgi:hypothetical protein
VVSFTHGNFIHREETPRTKWVSGLVEYRAEMDVEQMKNPAHARN